MKRNETDNDKTARFCASFKSKRKLIILGNGKTFFHFICGYLRIYNHYLTVLIGTSMQNMTFPVWSLAWILAVVSRPGNTIDGIFALDAAFTSSPVFNGHFPFAKWSQTFLCEPNDRFSHFPLTCTWTLPVIFSISFAAWNVLFIWTNSDLRTPQYLSEQLNISILMGNGESSLPKMVWKNMNNFVKYFQR